MNGKVLAVNNQKFTEYLKKKNWCMALESFIFLRMGQQFA